MFPEVRGLFGDCGCVGRWMQDVSVVLGRWDVGGRANCGELFTSKTVYASLVLAHRITGCPDALTYCFRCLKFQTYCWRLRSVNTTVTGIKSSCCSCMDQRV